MPKFKKSTGFKMRGYSYPGKSPLRANGEGKIRTKTKLYEDTQGKYYKEADGSKTYISPETHAGYPRNGVNPYEGEKKRWFTEGGPSQRKEETTTLEKVKKKVKKYIKTKKKDIKDFFNI